MTIRASARPARTTKDPSQLQISATIEFLYPTGGPLGPLAAAVLGGLLGLLIGFVIATLLLHHGPTLPPDQGESGGGWDGDPIPPEPPEDGSWVDEVERWLHARQEALARVFPSSYRLVSGERNARHSGQTISA